MFKDKITLKLTHIWFRLTFWQDELGVPSCKWKHKDLQIFSSEYHEFIRPTYKNWVQTSSGLAPRRSRVQALHSNHFPPNQRRFKCISSHGYSKEPMYFWIHPEMIYICPGGDLTLEPYAITHTWLMTPPSLGPSMPTAVCSVTRFLSDRSRAVASPKGAVKNNSRPVCASGHLACSKCIGEAHKPLIVTGSWN